MDQAENLRTIIKQQNQVNVSNARIITITSGKGGVGKSSVAINLAIEFTKMGKKVIVFDADFGLANIEVMLGVIPKATLADLMFRGKDIKEIITEGPGGVSFVSGGSGIARLVNLDREQVKRVVYKMSELESLADVIIIDTGAGISPSVLEFVAASPEVLLVATPEPTSITDSYALLKALAMFPGYDRASNKIMLVANKVGNEKESKNIYEKLSVVVSRFLNIKLNFIGSIPSDNALTKAIMKQKPVTIATPSAASAEAFKALADNLEKGEATIPHQSKGVFRFFSRVFGNKH